MTTFVKLYVQGESSKMPVVYDRFGTNGLKKNINRKFMLASLKKLTNLKYCFSPAFLLCH
jgi:coproporphyrinogen III oxidase